jgi:hypothetical protein
VEQLEILRMVAETPHAQWNAADLARAAQIEAARIVGHLAALEQRGFVKTESARSQLFCGYCPQSGDLDAMLRRLLQFYKERPVTLINTVRSRTR